MSLLSVSFQQVQPKNAAPGVAQEGSPAPSAAPTGGPMGFQLILMLGMFGLLFFFMFRKQKKEASARSSLKKGDQVVTNSGLVGELVELTDRFAKVKIAPGTTVTMLSQTVSPFAPEPTAVKDLKDAKAVSDKK